MPDRRSSTPRERSMTLPELPEDLILEILVFVRDDPACLVRASLACKPWRRLLTGPDFLRRYRALHRTPPMLGFFYNVNRPPAALFVPTSSFRTAGYGDRSLWRVIAAAHGRALFHTVAADRRLVVWDPVTGQQRWLPTPMLAPSFWEPVRRSALATDHFHAAVFCARSSAGCDHLGCHGGPFRVAFVAVNRLWRTFARLYSSESGEWSEPIEIGELASIDRRPSVLLGNSVYFTCLPHVWPATAIMEYDMAGKGRLSLIDPPLLHRTAMEYDMVAGGMLILTEAGTLGFAAMRESRLYLWSREVDPQHGVVAWAQDRVIELETLLLARPKMMPRVVGFAAEGGGGVVFVRLNSGVFSVELKSGNTRKMPSPGRIYLDETKRIFPYMTFYTPGTTTGSYP